VGVSKLAALQNPHSKKHAFTVIFTQHAFIMENLKIATAQFENKSGDKAYNLSVIKQLAAKAASQGAQVVAFHECSITGYSFARNLNKQQMLDVAEFIPDGPSVKKLTEIAAELNITILAGLFEKDDDDRLYKAYVCVDKNGLVAKYRKLHPFINPNLTPGDRYVISTAGNAASLFVTITTS
jgi:predicted amidohydrolase